MKYRSVLFLLLGSLILSFLLFGACGDDDDDDDDDATPPFDEDDDDDDDDTTPPADDDDDDDDDDDENAPQLLDAYWTPDTFDMTEACLDDEAEETCTALLWEVCDPDANLSGGMIYAYAAGTTEPAFGDHFEWDEFLEEDPVIDDCENPFVTGINVYFDGDLADWCPEAGESYFIGVDMEVSDADGNFSETLTDIEVVWNCPS